MNAPFAMPDAEADAGQAAFRRAVIQALRRGIVADDRRAGQTAKDNLPLPVTMSNAPSSGADWMVALADAWAMVGDILRFYRGRIAAEAYLGTARDERAIEMLLGSIGHARDPGSAATALVSLALAAGAGEDAQVTVPRGARLQTVPGPGQMPTVFQTDHDLVARAAWSRIAMAPIAPPPLLPSVASDAPGLTLAGPVRSIGPGSVIHIGDGSGAGALRVVTDVAGLPRDGAPSDTVVTLVPVAAVPVPFAGPAIVSRFDLRTKMFGALAPAWASLPLRTRLTIGRVEGGVSIRAGDDRPWTPANAGLAAPLGGALVAIAADRVIAAGAIGLIGWNGAGWTMLGGGAPTTAVTALRIGQGRAYAGTVDGRLFMSVDRGDSWNEIDAPATPPARRLIPPFAKPGPLPKAPIRAVAVTGDAIAVATDAGIWRSAEPGAGWLAWSEGLPGAAGEIAGAVTALAVAPDGTAFAGTATGLFARASDARRWSRHGAVTDAVRDLAVTGGAMIVLTATDVVRIDAAATSIWPATAREAPAAIAASSDGLAVAAASGLYRSSDGGRTWHLPEGEEAQPIVRVAIAPDGAVVRAAATLRPADSEWPGFQAADGVIDLGSEVPEIVAGSLVAVLTPDRSATCRVAKTEMVRRAGFGLDAVVTRLVVDTGDLPLSSLDLRTTEILAISRPMAIAAPQGAAAPSSVALGPAPLVTPVDPTVPPLPPGRMTILTGGAPSAAPLELHGNVVSATEGRTIAGEVLGNGDPTIPGQQFTLAAGPLTHVDGADGLPTPIVSLTVNGASWTRVDSLVEAGPVDRVFEVALTPDGRGILCFGDGGHGARLPQGRGNVVATYSVGIGGAAPVAGQLATVLQTPVRLAGVLNPIAGTAGRSPQRASEARAAAPTRWRSSGRLVSLGDYRGAAALAPGVGAARVERLATPRGAMLAISVIGVSAAGADLTAVVAADAVAAAAVRELVAARGDDPASIRTLPCRRRAIAIGLASDADAAARAATLLRAAGRLSSMAAASIAGTISAGRLSMALNHADDPSWLAVDSIAGGSPDAVGIDLDPAGWDGVAWQVVAAEAAWFPTPTLSGLAA